MNTEGKAELLRLKIDEAEREIYSKKIDMEFAEEVGNHRIADNLFEQISELNKYIDFLKSKVEELTELTK